MAYGGDWTSILTPFLQGVEGDTPLLSSFDDLNWLEDEQELDPFTTEFDSDVRRLVGDADKPQPGSSFDTAVRARESFSLPVGANRGQAAADRIAASKGVDPGTKGGTGRLIDIAKTMLGVPYIFGSGPGTDAFDCSEFTQWVYSRAMGVALPRNARDQAASIGEHVKRDDLQPGDLVFYVYGRLGEQVDHVAIYIGNGKQIAASSSADKVTIQGVDWEHFVYGGRRPGTETIEPAKGQTNVPKRQMVKRRPVEQSPELAPMALSDGPPAFAAVLDSILSPDTVPYVTEKTMKSVRGGSLNAQLKRGFIDAGRPDLARLVGTRDWNTWINAESGGDPNRVSQPYDGVRNYGLFQFRGHPWQDPYITQNGMGWTMTAYEQARAVARYFSLSVGDVHRYASEIRNGNYHGWG